MTSSEEQYGHSVLNELTNRYELDNDDQRIRRVRDLADKLTAAAKADHNPWHVYVLVDDSFENAAATRGNFLFVWTGLLNRLQNDSELAIVLAHEIGHALAGHTQPTPAEEVAAILADVGGATAREVVSYQGQWGALAGLAEILVSETLRALVVNPGSQQKELEADHIGLFLLADAGFDPQQAIEFWKRMSAFEQGLGSSLSFLSTHPSGEERFAALSQHLPAAQQRYARATGKSVEGPASSGSGDKSDWIISSQTARRPQRSTRSEPYDMPTPGDWTLPARNGEPGGYDRLQARAWVVQSAETRVYASPDRHEPTESVLVRGTGITVIEELTARAPRGVWLRIENPSHGFVMSGDCSPLK